MHRPTVVAAVIASMTALVFACGSDDESKFGGQSQPTTSFGNADGSFGSSGGDPDVNLFANDPPPKWCGPGGDPAPPQPGGTEECPDDKNLPGCACDNPGETRPCWTGLRRQRGVGVCKDGTTTCQKTSEVTYGWSQCQGEVLPTAGATKGADACTCFSAGQWKIKNLGPCTVSSCNGPTCTFSTISTFLDDTNTSHCEPQNPPAAPTQDWSTDTLKVDCAGHFRLCLRIRQGSFGSPSPNDCVLGEVCTESDYKEANIEQAWPNLPGWLGQDAACSKKWSEVPDNQSPGYAEMVVKGQSVRCDAIDDGNGGDLVFNRIQYCPLTCNDPANQANPECVTCGHSGQGSF